MKKLFKNQFFVMALSVLVMVLFERTVPVVTLTDRAIVVAVGIDKEGEDYVVSAEIVRPTRNEGSQGATAYSVVKGKGRSLSAAIAEIGKNCSKSASLAHCNLVVLGEYIKEKGEYPNFENLASSYGLPYEAKVVLSDDKAQKVMEYMCLYEVSGLAFVDYLKSDRISTEQFTSTVKKLLYDGTITGAYTRLLTVNVAGEEFSIADKPQTSWLTGLEMKTCYLIKYGKKAVRFDEQQTKTINLILEKPKVGNVTVSVDGVMVNLQIESASTKLSYEFDGQKPIVAIKTKIELRADEFDSGSRDLSKTEEDFFKTVLGDVKNEVEQQYSESVAELWEYAASNDVDFLEIYEGFSRYESKKWKEYAKEDYLSQVDYSAEIKVVFVGVE